MRKFVADAVIDELRRNRAEKARFLIGKFGVLGFNPENLNDQLFLERLERDWDTYNQLDAA
jgi:hypothetical protein